MTAKRLPKKWMVRPPDESRAAELAAALGVSRIVGGLLAARGYHDAGSAQSFLKPSLDQLHDPFLMRGMSDAVKRLLSAIDNQEPILVYGDYDVDGTTGTAVLLRAFRMLGATAGYHVPHRFTEGYGIQQAGLEKAASEGYKLVVSVDCGIRAHEPLHWARANGLDVIITDHHLPDDDEGSPPALAVLNPNQHGCDYPDKNLAGVGVAFKLVHALFRERGKESVVPGFLKMVAIGTVADVAKLIGENRAIVALGLSDLPRGVIGLAASKIAERLHRPCVVISFDGDVGHGSARSIEAYHLFDGLTTCRDLLDKFGGHSHAAGLAIRRECIPEFRRRLNEHAASCLTEEDLTPALNIDAEVSARALGFQLSQELRALEPFGAGNPRPLFVTRGLRVLTEPQIIKEQHLKLRVAGDDNRPFEAIWWRGVEEVEQAPEVNQRIDLAYELEANRWNGDIKLQLNIKDMKTNSTV